VKIIIKKFFPILFPSLSKQKKIRKIFTKNFTKKSQKKLSNSALKIDFYAFHHPYCPNEEKKANLFFTIFSKFFFKRKRLGRVFFIFLKEKFRFFECLSLENLRR